MSLLSMVTDALDDAMSSVSSQANDVVQVQSIIGKGLEPIMQGAWQGRGAQAFILEVTTVLLPQVADLIASIFGVQTSIADSMAIVKEADQFASGLVDDLADVVAGISWG